MWTHLQSQFTDGQAASLVTEATEALGHLPLATLRDRAALTVAVQRALDGLLRRRGILLAEEGQRRVLVAQILARIGGLGFLDGLLPPACTDYTDLLVNGNGTVWGRVKGARHFVDLGLRPAPEEVWRAVDALLSPQGRACTEATPSVDARLPRDPDQGFGGARIKVLHPSIAAGEGYPTLALRLYEPEPVPPQRMVAWGALPETVMVSLLAAVAKRLRILVVGGTATGKTTLLSALCHGIPGQSRLVKVEDPEEIWTPHPNTTTLEARPAPPGSDVAPYTVADGVDDAMRLAPSYLIVGEVRTGDAALSLFRALMSDHAGLTTFHAEGPEEAVVRLGVILFADAQVRFDAARSLFAQAIDLVIHVGWQQDRRVVLGVWEVAGLTDQAVTFRPLWTPGQPAMSPPSRVRG